jgi:hypothetical protein
MDDRPNDSEAVSIKLVKLFIMEQPVYREFLAREDESPADFAELAHLGQKFRQGKECSNIRGFGPV